MLFETRDKSGRKIRLSRKQWKHTQKHPEMSGSLELIKDCLRNPDKVTGSPHDSEARFYYRFHKPRKEYLVTLVKYLNGNGFVITSFFTDKIK